MHTEAPLPAQVTTNVQPAIKLQTTVLPGKRIEFTAPELSEGQRVEVIVVMPNGRAARPETMLQFLQQPPTGPRLFETPEDVDAYLRQERASWDR